jgi:hypothetical protein
MNDGLELNRVKQVDGATIGTTAVEIFGMQSLRPLCVFARSSSNRRYAPRKRSQRRARKGMDLSE